MDHFGIGAALEGVARVYFQAGRRTGRTTSMVESAKEGDRLIFLDSKEAERVRRLCLERGVKVRCTVLDPRHPNEVFQWGTAEGRVIFDHSWVEKWFLQAIERAAIDLDYLQEQCSGEGPGHRETRRRAEELAKWRP